MIWLVWEMVPGLRLGDPTDPFGAAPFWALDFHEREKIRVAFLRGISCVNKLPLPSNKTDIDDN